MVRACGVLYMFTSKRASHHDDLHFFDIATSKSAPRLKCFVHVHLQISFAPQRHALFRHLHFQKCSGAGVLCTLPNVLRATSASACNFASFIWPAGSAPAALASLLSNPPEPQNIGKTQCVATTLYTFSRTCIFSLPDLLLLIFSMSELLSSCGAFLSVHIVRSLASKLPSTM